MNMQEAYQMVLDDLEKRREEVALTIRALKHYNDCPLAKESLISTLVKIELDPTLKPGEWYLRKAAGK